MAESIVIVGAARTPMGGFQGDFSTLAAHDLGAAANLHRRENRARRPGGHQARDDRDEDGCCL